jgi:NAD(P)H dehydrogenase (quinone)
MKNYLDQTAHLWTKGALEGKVAGVFTCGASPYGGYGSTLLSMVIPLLHLGMLVAGLPYTAKTEGGKPAGSPYGASAFVGQNADQPPVENDLHLARVLGHRVASIARQTVPRRAE